MEDTFELDSILNGLGKSKIVGECKDYHYDESDGKITATFKKRAIDFFVEKVDYTLIREPENIKYPIAVSELLSKYGSHVPYDNIEIVSTKPGVTVDIFLTGF